MEKKIVLYKNKNVPFGQPLPMKLYIVEQTPEGMLPDLGQYLLT